MLAVVEEFAPYRPEGIGKNVGVCGRDVIDPEAPPPDSLDWGRRKPVLAAIGFIGPVLSDGEVARVTVEVDGRKAVGAVGIETLRLSLSLLASFSLFGEGESSIIRTHPDESPLPFFEFLSEPLSLLRRESMLFL